MFKLNFKFTKKGFTKYISHLDLMRLLSRAMRRAGLALKFSEGYSPHVKLSLKRALKLGLESEEEEGKIAFVSQSEAFGRTLLDWGISSHLGLSMFASLGTMIDVDFADLGNSLIKLRTYESASNLAFSYVLENSVGSSFESSSNMPVRMPDTYAVLI